MYPALRSSRGLLAVTLALLSGGFQLAVALRVDLLLTPRQHVLRRDVAGGTVQALVVVTLYVALDQTPRIFQRQRRSRPNALAFQRLVPPLDLAVSPSLRDCVSAAACRVLSDKDFSPSLFLHSRCWHDRSHNDPPSDSCLALTSR